MNKDELDKYVEGLKAQNWEDKYDKDFMRVGYNKDFDKMVEKPIFILHDWLIKETEPICKESHISLLDVGCCNGLLLYRMLQGLPIDTATGVDVSDVALTTAKSNLKQFGDKVKLVKSFGEKLPFKDNEFDVVVSAQVIEHVKDPRQFISEAVRVAKICALFVTPIENKIEDPMHINSFTYDNIIEMFEETGYDFSVGMMSKFRREDVNSHCFGIRVIKNE